MKGAIVIATILVATTLGACRSERYHEPMKLGLEVQPITKKASQ
ncbi:MAG TPA: hypothetical protein TECP_00852 [Hyphomicrobiaceae bacterium MAG_BT-2024]